MLVKNIKEEIQASIDTKHQVLNDGKLLYVVNIILIEGIAMVNNFKFIIIFNEFEI